MKILIEQNSTGTGRFWWDLNTGPEHIDRYCGFADTLGEAFEEIIKSNTFNATRYSGE